MLRADHPCWNGRTVNPQPSSHERERLRGQDSRALQAFCLVLSRKSHAAQHLEAENENRANEVQEK